MSFRQLDPALPIRVEDKGEGYAFAVIDYGQEHNLIWVTAINETGEIWCPPRAADMGISPDIGHYDEPGPGSASPRARRPKTGRS